MRSYYDIIDDIKNGLAVSKKEATYVAQAADAMLHFALKNIRDIAGFADKNANALTMKIKMAERYTNEYIIKSKKLPIDEYLGSHAVDELEYVSEKTVIAKELQKATSDAIDSGDMKKVVRLWANGRIQ